MSTLFGLAQAADPRKVRRLVSIPFALCVLGAEPAEVTPHELRYRTPWREDSNPSLRVYHNGETWRAGDWADRFNGDVTDVVRRMVPESELTATLVSLVEHPGRATWQDPVVTIGSGSEVDPHDREQHISYLCSLPRVGERSHPLVDRLLASHPAVGLDTMREFDVRIDASVPGGELVIPYSDWATVKFRSSSGTKLTLGGSKLRPYGHPGDELFGHPAGSIVLLTEGETDTWAAFAAVPRSVQVIGLPGVGYRSTQLLQSLCGFTVWTAFDGDRAGYEAAEWWEQRVGARSIRLLGGDLASRTPGAVAEVLQEVH